MKSIALHMENVAFRYFADGKRNILNHVSLDIEEGGITVLMGSSGCGKSTLAAVAAGLYPENGGFLEAGTVELFGHPIVSMNQQERAAYLTMMFQNPDLQFCMNTLRKEMQFCMENICIPREEMDGRMKETVHLLHMEHLLDQKLDTLSGGEKQKAVLCCLAVMDSKCILLDEAFANIDSVSVKELITLLKDMNNRGKTIIAIEHQPDAWMEIADEFIILGEGGRVLQRGITPENLLEYKDLFEQEGLFYAGNQLAHTGDLLTKKNVDSKEEQAIVLQDVSILHEMSSDYLLFHADATFPKACITAILGPSGCGKTTTFLSILKQYPYSGRIEVNGADISKIKEKELFSRIGVVFQNPGNQFITQNVTEEVQAGIRLWNKDINEEALQGRTKELLEDYGLQRYHRYSPYMLSQGQQRRLAVLSVLSGNQKILFLDEPTYGQDYRSTMAIMEQLRYRIETEQLTVVFITHDVELAKAWADKIYCLKQQKLIVYKPEEEWQ